MSGLKVYSKIGYCFPKNRMILGSCQRAKKLVGHEGDGDTNCSWRTWNSLYGLEKKKVLEIRGSSETIKTPALLRLTRILRKVLKT